MINTIETRLQLDLTQENIINSCVLTWSEFYRKTWVMFNNKQLNETTIYHNLKNSNYFTSNQINSLINKVKTEHSKIKELTKTQLKSQQDKLNNINKFIEKENKLIAKKKSEIIKLKKELVKSKDKNKIYKKI